ncbi:MAG TPA: putative 2OG-Fe(II) oxygenase [Allosphingosinicella sp.]|nr:putative 2OG-Fe(II) oxygenase [Allosphingosinicella sp.]
MTANPDVIERAYSLLNEGRVPEALEISTRLAATAGASHDALVLHSAALKRVQRHEEALAIDLRAAGAFPRSGAAWHNLATTLGELGRGAEALEALAKGFSVGLDSPLSWQVKARAHVACGDLVAAEAAYREASARAPDLAPLAAEAADFMWMARGDLASAQAPLDRAFHAGAPPTPLLMAKAKLLASAGDREQAADLLDRGAGHLPDDLQLVLAAAQAALEAGRLADAERHIRSAEALAPGDPGALVQSTIVSLALGRTEAALISARKALAVAPLDQSALAWNATAARAAGDPLYAELCDYEMMVGVFELEPPAGWASLEDFLRDLTSALDRHHVMAEHPSAQSLRHGTQTTYRLSGARDPVIQAFFQALDEPLRAHIAKLGAGPDPLRRRNSGGYRIIGAWSVRLRQGGFHLDHMHNEGWISSAFYVETPDGALGREGKEGWLRLGQPPFPTVPEQPAERFIRPKPGRLVLFPSYMWHGTVPFHTEERRTTIAFDIVPET